MKNAKIFTVFIVFVLFLHSFMEQLTEVVFISVLDQIFLSTTLPRLNK